ncbi:hypothetical protein HPB48_011609 [Haemaphysalis longicornis]|uniref:Uncharacterized protein n=1 Tax=Haemaphysalis longicornis TaxID=44386 RepID=A0A9J6GF45_HAELO|nr:hypothetical protein HPB48_011609 [Haemaphysalis longicornis]
MESTGHHRRSSSSRRHRPKPSTSVELLSTDLVPLVGVHKTQRVRYAEGNADEEGDNRREPLKTPVNSELAPQHQSKKQPVPLEQLWKTRKSPLRESQLEPSAGSSSRAPEQRKFTLTRTRSLPDLRQATVAPDFLRNRMVLQTDDTVYLPYILRKEYVIRTKLRVSFSLLKPRVPRRSRSLGHVTEVTFLQQHYCNLWKDSDPDLEVCHLKSTAHAQYDLVPVVSSNSIRGHRMGKCQK